MHGSGTELAFTATGVRADLQVAEKGKQVAAPLAVSSSQPLAAQLVGASTITPSGSRFRQPIGSHIRSTTRKPRDHATGLSRTAAASSPATATAPHTAHAFNSAWPSPTSGTHSASPAAPSAASIRRQHPPPLSPHLHSGQQRQREPHHARVGERRHREFGAGECVAVAPVEDRPAFRFCCKLSWRAERGLAAGFGQAAHWNSSATKAA